jgi:ABC transporter substrate binding protein (PQQ-dependent alcohol dehydrogenase system)
MISSTLSIFLLLWMALPALAIETVGVAYIGLQDDPYYLPQTSYTGLSLKDRHRPLDGARLAQRDARILSRALGIKFKLDELLIAPGQNPADVAREARETGAVAVLVDLPTVEMTEFVQSWGTTGVLINVRDPANHWRGNDCAPALLHTVPSLSMQTDALAQLLRYRNWPRILLLHGTDPSDLTEAAAVQASARKFGLKVVKVQEFELSNDPRQRDLNNIALLTGNVRHDVIWLVDMVGEFGRYIPYVSQQPRPVIGAEGLNAVAWHWTWERYGAPQLNQRFRRLADRDMTSTDWAGWVAFRIVVAAAEAEETADRDILQAAIRSGDLAIDLYKGPRGSIRIWDGQLRQPILLATHNAVVATAPFDGFEHQTDTLDTLGTDKTESECR